MVRKVQPHHKRQIQDDIDREKKNIFLCMHPAATVVTIPDIAIEVLLKLNYRLFYRNKKDFCTNN